MAKPKEADFATLLYLAHILPLLRRRSDEAAFLVEAAIVDGAMAIAGARNASTMEIDVVPFLRHALDDVAAISPTGQCLVERAIHSLSDEKRDATVETTLVH